MSHSVKVNLIANQTISFFGKEVNIHDIETICLDSNGEIESYKLKCTNEFIENENKLDLEEVRSVVKMAHNKIIQQGDEIIKVRKELNFILKEILKSNDQNLISEILKIIK